MGAHEVIVESASHRDRMSALTEDELCGVLETYAHRLNHWRDDLVIFALGCSFSFEDALMQDGIELRHISNGSTVPMYRTSVPTTAAGPFRGQAGPRVAG